MEFRFSRHTNNLARLTKFYVDVLGFEIIGKFENHNNYNGVFLGLPNANWHLEFTQSDEKAKHTFDEDDILVFYPSTIKEYKDLYLRIKQKKIDFILPKNAYWETNGIMILDPDGYRVVFSPSRIKK
jgi:catechol 2,3-dioxygenase-like lactoylglutathione lyase family enzyme